MNFITTAGHSATNALVAGEITVYQVDSGLLVTVQRGKDAACSTDSNVKIRALSVARLESEKAVRQ